MVKYKFIDELSLMQRWRKDQCLPALVPIPAQRHQGPNVRPCGAHDYFHGAMRGTHIDLDYLERFCDGDRARMTVFIRMYLPSALLMDVQMPEMNGYDATQAIRTLLGDKSRVPILTMTANVMKEEVDRCVVSGMNGYVPKPFMRQQLAQAIALSA